MSRITKETIDRIFETARIEEVIGEFVQLKRAGSNFKGLSPFNNEKTPSFMVSPAKQIFKDFSSGKGGSVVTFLMELEQFTYPEALKWLANKYNIEIEEDQQQTPEQEKAADEREAIYVISEFAQKWFSEQLQSDEGKKLGLSYFHERGFTDETIEKFKLGYALVKKDAFATEALAKGYSEKVLQDSGISLKREGQSSWYDRFWGRVIFPIHSLSGRVLGFGGRVLNAEAKTAKYLNSPESPIYHKSKILFGLYQARKAIVKQDEAFLVEGYTDVISLHQIEVENVVSSSGTALTEDQIRLLKRYTNNVTILYDGDPAGIRASFRGIDMFLQEGVNVRVVLFPDGDDPDSYARKTSRIEFNEFIAENRTDFIRFKAGLLMKDAENDPIKKADIIRDIIISIGKIPDEISRDVFIKESARILSMDETVLFNELALLKAKELRESSRKGARPTMQVVEQRPPTQVPLVDKAKESLHYEQELEVIKLLINHGNDELQFPEDEDKEVEFRPTVSQFLIADIIEDETSFNNVRFQQVYNICVEHLMREEPVPESTWYLKQEDEDLAKINADLITQDVLSKNWEEKHAIFTPTPEERLTWHTPQVALRFKNAKLKTKMAQVRESLKNEELPDEERTALMEEFQSLNKIHQQVNKKLNRIV